MNKKVDNILEILVSRGNEQYSMEAVSQLEHALQCAVLAEKANATPELITASLLHDFGHLIHDLGEDAAEKGIDDRHEYRALGYLNQIFSPAVTEPIRMHVDAKRYLCTVDNNYWDSLSTASKVSLELQGGIYSGAKAREFISQTYAKDAVKLRIWDDLAKIEGLATPGIEYFVSRMEKVIINNE